MTNNPVEPTDESIEDILSSIRETVEEETTREDSDLDPEALAEEMLAEQIEEDAPEEEAPAAVPEGDIDESLMSATEVDGGTSDDSSTAFEEDMHPVDENEDVDDAIAEEAAAVAAAASDDAPAADDGMDGLMSETAAEDAAGVSEDDVLDLVDEIGSEDSGTDDDFVDVEHFEETGETKPANTTDVEEAQGSYKAAEAEEDMSEVLDDIGAEEISDEAVLAAFKGATAGAGVSAAQYKHLNALPSAEGLQVGFPMEVLAEALRPLVKGWIQNNLPEIVERLVKEELEKLADK